jgi:predicted transposase/invertase (TIGR01784 family)
MNVFFIELPKIEQQNISIKDMTSIERWAKYFRNAADESKQDLIQELTKYEEGIMDAQAVLNRISTNDAMWVQQKHYYDAIARENTIISENYEKGRAEGSHAKAIETARNFLRMGLSKEQVAQGTGLTMEEINKLR